MVNDKDETQQDSHIQDFPDLRDWVLFWSSVVAVGVIIGYFNPDFGSLLVIASSAIATIFMVWYIAIQAVETRKMVEQTKSQIELTKETLYEMRKQRIDIESVKYAIRAYLKRGIVGTFGSSSFYQSGFPRCDLFLHDLYLRRYNSRELSPEEWGRVIRICKISELILKKRGIFDKIQEANELVQELKKVRDGKRVSRSPDDISKKLAELRQELSSRITELVEADQLLEEYIIEVLEEGY